jgi:hypothetical protein
VAVNPPPGRPLLTTSDSFGFGKEAYTSDLLPVKPLIGSVFGVLEG